MIERSAQFGEHVGQESTYKHEFWERTSKGSTYRGLAVTAERTDDGERWAKHVGGDMPPRIPR